MDQLHIEGRLPVALNGRKYILGRNAECDIVLQTPQASVSRQHATLEWNNIVQCWSICDLNSTNGVYVNGRRISSITLLSDKDRITIGDNILTLEAPRAAATNLSGPATVASSFPQQTSAQHPQSIPQSTPQKAIMPHARQGQNIPASPNSFCSNCGTAQTAGAAFCSSCGNNLSTSQQPSHAFAGGYAPPHTTPQNQQVNVNVVNKSSDSGWIAALLILLFATPLGCISIPATIALIALLFIGGTVFFPVILAVVAAIIVWKHPGISQEQKPTIIGAIILGGILIEAFLFMAPTMANL